MNLDGSKDWVPENMAFDNNDAKSMNSALITHCILSLSHDGTAGSDTGGLWVVLSGSSVVPVCRLPMMLVYRLTVVVVTGGSFKGGLSEPRTTPLWSPQLVVELEAGGC